MGVVQPARQPAIAVERRAGVFPVYQPHQCQVQRRFAGRRPVQRRPIEVEQLALAANAERWVVGLDHRPFHLNRTGQLFFQPLQFHLQPADLFVQFGFAHGLFVLCVRMTVVEHRRPIGQQLLLPGADLVGVNIVVAGDLVDGLESFDRFQGDGELELVAELPAYSAHLTASTRF